MIEEPTLNTNKSGRSPWGQMCCFTPVILVPRQEDKKYKISLRDPVVIYFFYERRREGGKEKEKEPPGEGCGSREGLASTLVSPGNVWL